MKEKRHIWEITPEAAVELSINFNDNFIKCLKSRLPSNRSKVIRMLNNSKLSKSYEVKVSHGRWYNWFNKRDLNIPLWAAIELSNLADISKIEMEENINFYKQKYNVNRAGVRNPKLPIEIDEELISLAGHLYFDGSLPKDGRGTEYSQKNKVQRKNFIGRIQNCFGEVKYSENKDSKDIPKIKFPRIIGKVCKHILNIKSFGTFDATIPKIVREKEGFSLSFLVSAIIDEGGCMDTMIQIQLSNKNLVNGLKNLCKDLGYECSTIRKREREGTYLDAYYFYLKSVEKLYEDVKENDNYIDFSFKEDEIKNIIKYKNFPRGNHTKKTAKNRREKILSLLEGDSRKSTKEIAGQIKVRPRSVRRHLTYLRKKGKVKKIKNGKTYYYCLDKPH